MNNNDFPRQLMKAIQQTDEWDRIWKEDPGIQQAKDQLENVMEQVGLKIPGQLLDDLWTAVYSLTSASENAALHYGLRVMEAIHSIASNPEAIMNNATERRGADVSRGV